MIYFYDSEIEMINKALNYEKKANNKINVNNVIDVNKLSYEEILYICECLSGFVSKDNDFIADNIISKLLEFLEIRGDMQ